MQQMAGHIQVKPCPTKQSALKAVKIRHRQNQYAAFSQVFT
jgi:hypothetical protein